MNTDSSAEKMKWAIQYLEKFIGSMVDVKYNYHGKEISLSARLTDVNQANIVLSDLAIPFNNQNFHLLTIYIGDKLLFKHPSLSNN